MRTNTNKKKTRLSVAVAALGALLFPMFTSTAFAADGGKTPRGERDRREIRETRKKACECCRCGEQGEGRVERPGARPAPKGLRSRAKAPERLREMRERRDERREIRRERGAERPAPRPFRKPLPDGRSI